MAQPVDIGAEKPAKIRSVVWVAVLTLITVAIYLAFWWYFVNREMADYGRRRGAAELGDSPAKSVLALTLGALVVVPAVWTTVTTFKRVQALQRLTGEAQPVNGWIGLILFLVITPALYGYMQSGLNGAWRAVAAEQARAPAV
jgi:hypothetical protein